MACISPLAKAGFKMLAASMAPSVAPAPTRVCISSIKRMISPSESVTSLTTAFKRSSNSPLNLVPAINAPMSKAKIRFCLRPSGTSPRTIRNAIPSAIAVLPTPGSPISTGLFLVLLDKICMTLRISASLPMTGSNLFFSAHSFKSLAYFFNAAKRLSAFGSSTFCPPRVSLSTC